MNGICRRTRRALEQMHEQRLDRPDSHGGSEPDPRVARHLRACEACNRYAAMLRELGPSLSAAMAQGAAHLPAPDFHEVHRLAAQPNERARGRRASLGVGRRQASAFRPLLLAAAAVFLLATAAVFPLYRYVQGRRTLGTAAGMLISDLLSRRLLEGVEFSAADSLDRSARLLDEWSAERTLFSRSLSWLDDQPSGPP